jgi:hypothetical protein
MEDNVYQEKVQNGNKYLARIVKTADSVTSGMTAKECFNRQEISRVLYF